MPKQPKPEDGEKIGKLAKALYLTVREELDTILGDDININAEVATVACMLLAYACRGLKNEEGYTEQDVDMCLLKSTIVVRSMIKGDAYA